MQLQIIEPDFKNEYTFRMCSVATNLVMSLEFNLVCCATIICDFGQTRKCTVATHFIEFSSTSTSSAASEYVAVPERVGQIEQPASRSEDWHRNKPSSAPKKT